MAHTIPIPVEFNCRMERKHWTVGKASVLRWKLDARWYVEIGLTSPANKVPYKQNFRVGYLPPEVSGLLPPIGEQMRGAVKSIEFDVLVGSPRKGDRAWHTVDPWEMRKDALALDQSVDAACDFLNSYGAWNRLWVPIVVGSLVVQSPLEIWHYQREYREALVDGPDSWFSRHRRPVWFQLRKTYPHFVHTASTCEEAINTSTTVDFLRGVRFALCPRPDCNKPFALERKGKIYCSQYCAHLVSVRKSRTKSSSVPSPK